MNIEQWVSNEIHQHGWINEAYTIITKRVGSVVSFGEVMVSGVIESIDEWSIVDTIGDGSCLIHSFLYLLSTSYDTLSREHKSELAYSLRRYLAIHMDCTDREREELASNVWLDDMIAEKIAQFLGYGLVILRVMTTTSGISIPLMTSTDDHGLKYLIIMNSGGQIGINGEMSDSGDHFEAVFRNGRTISSRQLGIDIEVKKNQLFEQAMERLQQRKRCDSPRQRRSIPESISQLEAKEMAKALDVYQTGDTKKALCKKLHELGQVDWYHRRNQMGVHSRSRYNSRRKQSNRLRRRKRSLSK